MHFAHKVAASFRIFCSSFFLKSCLANLPSLPRFPDHFKHHLLESNDPGRVQPCDPYQLLAVCHPCGKGPRHQPLVFNSQPQDLGLGGCVANICPEKSHLQAASLKASTLNMLMTIFTKDTAHLTTPYPLQQGSKMHSSTFEQASFKFCQLTW